MKKSKGNNRRKILIGLTGGIAGASQLPGKWTKPVINSVVLPAHAQTSMTTTTTTTTDAPLPTNFRNTNTPLASIDDSGFDKIISAFISEAYAGGFPSMGDCCVTSMDASSFDLKLLVEIGGFAGFYEINGGSVGGGSQTVMDSNGCFPNMLDIEVSEITDQGAEVIINGAMSIIPEGSGCPRNPGPVDDCQLNGSDIRLKTDIHALEENANGHQLYRFKYLDDPNQVDYVGVMAQDILKTNPDAVTTRDDGFYAVYYNQLGLKMTTLDQWEKIGIKSIAAA